MPESEPSRIERSMLLLVGVGPVAAVGACMVLGAVRPGHATGELLDAPLLHTVLALVVLSFVAMLSTLAALASCDLFGWDADRFIGRGVPWVGFALLGSCVTLALALSTPGPRELVWRLSRPALERLDARFERGDDPSLPRWCGLLRVGRVLTCDEGRRHYGLFGSRNGVVRVPDARGGYLPDPGPGFVKGQPWRDGWSSWWVSFD